MNDIFGCTEFFRQSLEVLPVFDQVFRTASIPLRLQKSPDEMLHKPVRIAFVPAGTVNKH